MVVIELSCSSVGAIMGGAEVVEIELSCSSVGAIMGGAEAVVSEWGVV